MFCCFILQYELLKYHFHLTQNPTHSSSTFFCEQFYLMAETSPLTS